MSESRAEAALPQAVADDHDGRRLRHDRLRRCGTFARAPASRRATRNTGADTNSTPIRSGSSSPASVMVSASNAAIPSKLVDCARQSRKSGYEAPRRSTFVRITLPQSSTSRPGSGYGSARARTASTRLKIAVLRADTDREHGDRDQRESGRFPKRPQRVADVLHEAFKGREHPHVARLLP